MTLPFFYMLLVSFLVQTSTAIYHLTDDYSGDTFFDKWSFFTDADPTHGHVRYQSRADSTKNGLISVQGDGSNSSPKQIFMGVDSTNQAPNGRSSVRIATQKTIHHGVVLADIAHQPGGICGVWPAFWMVGDKWPDAGEIDIVEGVSTQQTNQMTLHTNAGAVLDRTAEFSGNLLTTNCDVNAPNQPKNAGCGIADDSNITFGNDFNAVGGGVYATEWTSDFIKIWFFQRDQIPSDIQRGTPNPSDSWGTPNSLFQGKFNIDDHFKNLSIVLNTAFCGDWAGQVWSQTPECAKLAPTCDEYVTKNPRAFQEAFWLINSIKVFQDDGKSTSSTPPPRSTPVVPAPIVTITKTFTIYQTATSDDVAETSQTGFPPATTPEPDAASDVGFDQPDSVYGASSYEYVQKRRRGGAVLPLEVRCTSTRMN